MIFFSNKKYPEGTGLRMVEVSRGRVKRNESYKVKLRGCTKEIGIEGVWSGQYYFCELVCMQEYRWAQQVCA